MSKVNLRHPRNLWMTVLSSPSVDTISAVGGTRLFVQRQPLVTSVAGFLERGGGAIVVVLILG